MSRPPLQGVKVLDFTHVIAGPYCTMMLADMGADVVKVERPEVGDDLRHVGRYAGREEHEDYFHTVNRRKRSVVLDLSTPGDLAIAYRLAEAADVAVLNFAPATSQRLGIGPAELTKRNPRLVYAAISGFGQSGPLRDSLALDPIVQAYSGIMSATGDPDGPPMSVGAPIADVIAGMFAAYAIVSALFEARRSGTGAVLDVSMLESMLAVLGPRMGETLQNGRVPDRVGNENPMRVPAGMFQTSDGKFVTLMAHDQSQWPRFCRAIGQVEWIDDPRFATMRDRVVHRALLHGLIAEKMKTGATAREWLKRFTAERIPCAPVYNYQEALEDAHVRERGLIVELEHPVSGKIRVVGPPWKWSLPDAPLVAPPLLGNDAQSVMADWLGLASETAVHR